MMPRWFRAQLLKHDVESDRWGSALWLKGVAGRRSTSLTLHHLAGAVESGRELTTNERSAIAVLLRAVAEGHDVRKDLRIDAKKASRGRPVKLLRWQVSREVYARIDEGDLKTAAIEGVAADAGLTISTVTKSVEAYAPDDEPPLI